MASQDEWAKRVEVVFAQNLEGLRVAADMTQGDLAEAMSRRGFLWHQATVYKVENHKRQIQLGEAVAIADILKVPLAQLMSEDSDNSQRVVKLQDLHWDLSDARDELVTAVYKYGLARQALTEALGQGDRGWLSESRHAEMRHDAELAAIRDWPQVRAADSRSVTRNPPLDEAVLDAEA